MKVLVAVFVVAACCDAAFGLQSGKRDPRLFLVSSTTSTSTLTTSSFCYTWNTTPSTACTSSRRRRQLVSHPLTGEQAVLEFIPSKIQRDTAIESSNSGLKEGNRSGRFVYWMTTTSTTVSTSYTKTAQITFACTAASYPFSSCG